MVLVFINHSDMALGFDFGFNPCYKTCPVFNSGSGFDLVFKFGLLLVLFISSGFEIF